MCFRFNISLRKLKNPDNKKTRTAGDSKSSHELLVQVTKFIILDIFAVLFHTIFEFEVLIYFSITNNKNINENKLYAKLNFLILKFYRMEWVKSVSKIK